MADIITCERGHYYDRSVFMKCPHCEAGTDLEEHTTKYKNEVARQALEYLQEQTQGSRRAFPSEEDFRTVAHPRGETITEKAVGDRQEPEDDPVTEARAPRYGVPKEFYVDPEPSEVRTPKEERPVSKKQASQEDGKTIGFSVGSQKNYFVTGWLVCVEGPDTGHAFNLYYGYNTVGYSRNNQVCLMEDLSVAKKVHCSVVYEDRKNRFFLIPEEGFDTFRNGETVFDPEELLTGDVIRVGNSELEFIAFCKGERKWDRKDMQKAVSFR